MRAGHVHPTRPLSMLSACRKSLHLRRIGNHGIEILFIVTLFFVAYHAQCGISAGTRRVQRLGYAVTQRNQQLSYAAPCEQI